MSQSNNESSVKAKRPSPAGTDGHPAENPAVSDRSENIATREMQYMVGQHQGGGLSVSSFAGPATVFETGRVLDALSALPDCKVVRVVKQSRFDALSARPSAVNSDILVVRTAAPERARQIELLAQRNPGLLVERDYLLQHLGSFRPQLAAAPRSPSQITAVSVPVRFHVQDPEGRPIAGAEIVAYGDTGTEDNGKTDAQGNATVLVSGGYVNHTAALYIKPAANYWEHFVERPALEVHGVNTVTLRPLADFPEARFPGEPLSGDPFLGYGQRLMGLQGLDSAKYNGEGVRVAIIDSGCDTRHPALQHISIGRDFTNLDPTTHEPDVATWRDDQMSHGTHCAGIIAGNGIDGHIRGFVPRAEIHILKVFPGGAFNNLVAALNYCIDNQIHVVNCSLGGDVSSQLVAQTVERARQAGVAMFVAAGNSASAVQFPANVPGVLCVSAFGQAGNFPDSTYHARTAPDGAVVVPGQVYPARFTCHGPQVGVCGPGVGIISSVPGGYAAWDGTSMADPHVTGLGALLAAHHPALANAKLRDATWVDTLRGLLFATAQPTGIAPEYAGVGLPAAVSPRIEQPARPMPTPLRAAPPLSSAVIEQLVRSVIQVLPPP